MGAVERLRPQLLSIAARYGGGRSSEDVLQTATLLAHQNFEQFRGDSDAALASWLRRIVRNAALMKVRKQQSRKRAEAEFAVRQPDEGPRPSAPVRRAEQVNQLLQVMTQLPHAQQEVIELRYFEKCSVEEIAEQTDRSPDAVYRLLARALKSLRGMTSPSQWSQILG